MTRPDRHLVIHTMTAEQEAAWLESVATSPPPQFIQDVVADALREIVGDDGFYSMGALKVLCEERGFAYGTAKAVVARLGVRVRPVTHGTVSCYRQGCRLPECRAAKAAYDRAWRKRR